MSMDKGLTGVSETPLEASHRERRQRPSLSAVSDNANLIAGALAMRAINT